MILTIPMFRMVCDWPGCNNSPLDSSEYYAMSQPSDVREIASDADWWTDTHDFNIAYCPEHPVLWEDDYVDGLSEPDIPEFLYLRSDGRIEYIRPPFTFDEAVDLLTKEDSEEDGP